MSKYIRQVVFGNCNPSRQIRIEKQKVWEAAKYILDKYGESLELIQLGSDEAILKVTNEDFVIESQTEKCNIVEKFGTYVKIKQFTLGSRKFETPMGHTIRAYYKEFLNGSVEWKTIQKHYHAQIYELINNIQPDPEERDLVFYNEKEIAKFVGRLK